MDYQIRVKGQLEPHLTAWLGDFRITHTPDGDTLLTGYGLDQAALHGLFARCRDLGLTLISINPLPTTRGVTQMKFTHVEASAVINARPEDIYAVVSDYHVGHPAILPKPYFTELRVEKGGKGAGTVLWVNLKVFGRTYSFHQQVTEPEPGRVIKESDLHSEQYTTFTIEPLNGGQQSRVTIASEFPVKPGVSGFIESLTQQPFTRRLYKTELQNLAEYVQKQNTRLS